MRRKIKRSIRSGLKFKREFRRQIRMLVIITLGFTMAFTWRQTVFDASQSIVQLFIDVQNSTTLSVLTSLLITIISIFLVYLTAHFLKDDQESY